MNPKTKITIIGGGLLLAASLGLIILTKPAAMTAAPKGSATPSNSFDFGLVPLNGGKVKHTFDFLNASDRETIIKSVYTSCMCTTANLISSAGRWGPFGMPGHGFLPPVNVVIPPGEKAQVETIFDPAAHGPAGVGPIEREVYLETADGRMISYRITALVTP